MPSSIISLSLSRTAANAASAAGAKGGGARFCRPSALLVNTKTRRAPGYWPTTSVKQQQHRFVSNQPNEMPPGKRSSHDAFSTLEEPIKTPPVKNPEFSLKDRVIFVSGGARGLGVVVAEAILEAGAKVYALDRLEQPSPEFYEVQKRAEQELQSSMEYRQIDVRNCPMLNHTISEIGDKEGRIDGLLAAAGVQQETSALEYTAMDSNTMFEINVTGVFMTAQAVAKQMIRFGNGGSIAMIASMSGAVANKGLICPAYNASKAAVLQLARNLASEWGHYGIRVNTISPGYIMTSMIEKLFEEFPERRESWPRENMLGRLSVPKEYRGASVFLLSDASSFMTGSDLRMDGGHAAW